MSYSDPPPPPPEYGGGGQYGGQYGGGSPYGGTMDHPRGTTILILGILSLVCCGIFTGIPAWVMGNSARKEIDAAPGRYNNAGVVKAGWICGIIGTILSAVGLVIYIIIFAVAGTAELNTT